MTVLVTTARRLPARVRIAAAAMLAVAACIEVCAEMGYGWAIIVRNLLILVTFLALALTALASPVFAVLAVMTVIDRRNAAQKAREKAAADARAAESRVLIEKDRAAARVAQFHNEVVRYASRITVDPDCANAVIANAEPLMEWLREATTVADVEMRRAALRQQHYNRLDVSYPRDDDPHSFLAEAAKLYAFAQSEKQAEVSR